VVLINIVGMAKSILFFIDNISELKRMKWNIKIVFYLYNNWEKESMKLINLL